MRLALCLSLASTGSTLVACGGDGGSGGDDAPPDAAAHADATADSPEYGPFALTSPTIVEDGDIPPLHACADKGGQNQSPELNWMNAPSGTMSFAITFIDLSISGSGGFPHGTIYDIPASRTGIPASIEKEYAPPSVPGAHQSKSWQPSVVGWNGPCPPSEHTYQLKLYALSVPVLASATDDTATDDLVMMMSGVTLATATLTANFDPP